MEHQIVASGREGSNRRKGDPCPVIRDLWKIAAGLAAGRAQLGGGGLQFEPP